MKPVPEFRCRADSARVNQRLMGVTTIAFLAIPSCMVRPLPGSGRDAISIPSDTLVSRAQRPCDRDPLNTCTRALETGSGDGSLPTP